MFTRANAEAYFNAEKNESLLFLVIGITAIVSAVLLVALLKTNFYKGMAIPLFMIGVVQAVVGYTVYAPSDKQRVDIVYKMDMDPSALKTSELPRMEKVMKNFAVYRYTEIGLLIAGLAMFVFFRRNDQQQFWAGFGIALALQAFLMLFADGFAESRGRKYRKGMETYLSKKR